MARSFEEDDVLPSWEAHRKGEDPVALHKTNGDSCWHTTKGNVPKAGFEWMLSPTVHVLCVFAIDGSVSFHIHVHGQSSETPWRLHPRSRIFLQLCPHCDQGYGLFVVGVGGGTLTSTPRP